MSLLSRLFSSSSDAGRYPFDDITLPDGSSLRLTFFAHASIAIEYRGLHIYVDPVGQNADYESLPKADIILVTHSHYDHFDMAAIDALKKGSTAILCDKTSAESFSGDCFTMLPGATARPADGITVDAVAAYNTSPEQLQFHPRQREDCGYVIGFEAGLRIYISGDTEPIDEMRSLHDIDIAFICANQPYTMKPEQVREAVGIIRPKVLYPYHFGQVDEPTDVEALRELLSPLTEVRLRPLA
ncbi:MAG: MBL fold metallo-hydrolase [Alistipes sp.]|nr:MBL fold metallo-hydrolase [Alistipes sp.]